MKHGLRMMVLFLVCGIAEARAPEWLLSVPGGYGYINTKPDANRKCRYHVYGADIEIDPLSPKWKQTSWQVTTEILLPSFPTFFDGQQLLQHQEVGQPGANGEVVMVPMNVVPMDEDGNPLVPYVPDANDVCDYSHLCHGIEETWQYDLLEAYERVSGSAKLPSGMMISITQSSEEGGIGSQYIVDSETRTVWRLKAQ